MKRLLTWDEVRVLETSVQHICLGDAAIILGVEDYHTLYPVIKAIGTKLRMRGASNSKLYERAVELGLARPGLNIRERLQQEGMCIDFEEIDGELRPAGYVKLGPRLYQSQGS